MPKFALNRRRLNPDKHLKIGTVIREIVLMNRARETSLLFRVCIALAALTALMLWLSPRREKPMALDQYTLESPVYTYEIVGRYDGSSLKEMTVHQALDYVASHPGSRAFKISN